MVGQRLRKTVVQQALHYFSRPHEGVPAGPIRSPAAWRGAELAGRQHWIERLSAEQIAAFESGLDASASVPIEEMRRVDFPLRPMSEDLARWRREVQHGRGFLLLRGLPVESWGRERSERFFWGLGLHLGIPGAQNRDGELLGHVRDVGGDYADRSTRGYKTSARLRFHCDAADAVGLLCLATAAKGGESILVSSVSVFNELLARRPDLVHRLFEPTYFDTRGDGGVDYFPIPPCRFFQGELRTFFHGDYFRSVDQYADLPPLDAEMRALLDLYEEIASSEELRLDMSLEPGDVQLVSNHTVLHSRNAYVDDPNRKRHLLRLWLSFDGPASRRARASMLSEQARFVAKLAGLKVRRRLRGPSPLRTGS